LSQASFAPELKTGIFFFLEKLLNLPLANAPRARYTLAKLDNKILQIKVLDTKQDIFMKGSDRLELHGNYAANPDVTITANSIYLLQLILNQDPELLFSSNIKVTGDIETARAFQKFFTNVQLDSENILAGVVGDNAAHIFGKLARDAFAWSQDIGRRFADMAADYVKYETRITPDPIEVDEFIQGVDYLRSRLDILEARVSRIP